MNRRGFLQGIGALFAAPAIVQFANIMPVRGVIMDAAPIAGNRLLTADEIARRTLLIWNNNLVMARRAFRSLK